MSLSLKIRMHIRCRGDVFKIFSFQPMAVLINYVYIVEFFDWNFIFHKNLKIFIFHFWPCDAPEREHFLQYDLSPTFFAMSYSESFHFPHISLWKVFTFCSGICRKFSLSMYHSSQKVNHNLWISQQNRGKYQIYFLAWIQSLWGINSWKNWIFKSCATVLLMVPPF